MQQAPQAPAQGQQPQLDPTKMNIPAMLMEKLMLNEQQVMALIELLQQVKTPEEAIQLIKRFDLNPETMNQPLPEEVAPQQPAQPQRGLPVKE